MYNPIKNMKFSQISLTAISRIPWQLGMSKIALYFISVGHVYSLILGNSGHASRVIIISLAKWDEYQQASNRGGLAAS